MPKSPEPPPVGASNYELRDEVDLQQQINNLQVLVQSLCQAQAMENVMISGVTKLTAALAPLKLMAPKERALSKTTTTLLTALRTSIARPDYTAWSQRLPTTRAIRDNEQTGECSS